MPLDWMKTGHGRAALDDIVLERGEVDVLSRLEQLGGGDDPLLDVKALRLEGRLTPDDVGWQVPAWSPDGRYLAASLYCARTRAGCVVDLHEHVIWTTPNTMWRRPEWEPR